jgi:hypothetical protein
VRLTEHACAHHDHDAREPEHQPGNLARAHPFVSRENLRRDDGEDGSHRVQDGGKATGDLTLRKDEEGEGDGVVQKPHDEQSTPESHATREAVAT